MEKKVLIIAEKVAKRFGQSVFEPVRDYLLLLLSHIRVPDFKLHKQVRNEALKSVPGFGPALICALFLLRGEIDVPFEEFLDCVTTVVSSTPSMPDLPFGALMKSIRQRRGVKLSELARQLGVARGYLHAIERGRSLPSSTLLARIVEVLDPDGRGGLALAGIAAKLPDPLKNLLFPTD